MSSIFIKIKCICRFLNRFSFSAALIASGVFAQDKSQPTADELVAKKHRSQGRRDQAE